MVEHLFYKHEALSSSSSAIQKIYNFIALVESLQNAFPLFVG
jgi:hypothetical protein